MRVFWAMLAGLVVAAGVTLAMRRGADRSGAALPTGRTAIEPEPTDTLPAAGSPTDDEPQSVESQPVEPQPVAPEPVDPVDSEPAAADADAVNADEPIISPDAPPAVPGADAVPAGEAPGIQLNDRFRVTGSGTPADPFRVDFDMLVALEQDYEPKVAGKGEIPEWIKPLDGKHVVITGFIGFPFIAPEADECMVMLNQWDGCCIGVPPTPYDAVEVQLAEPVNLGEGVPNYGTVTGVFRTDPYLVNGWLMGVYVMEEARLENAGSKNQTGF